MQVRSDTETPPVAKSSSKAGSAHCQKPTCNRKDLPFFKDLYIETIIRNPKTVGLSGESLQPMPLSAPSCNGSNSLMV